MNTLHIKAQNDSPEIIFNPKTNVFSIEGVCHPENVLSFFQPVVDWLDNYLGHLKKTNMVIDLKVIFFFRYFNSATYKYLTVLLKKFNEFRAQGSSLFIEWHYESDDEDMKESGEELFEFSNMQIPHEFFKTPFKKK